METEDTTTSTWTAPETLIQTLTTRGWCFGDVDQVKAIIIIQSALHGDSSTVDFIESELANLDLRSVGAKSLPDPSVISKASFLPGPKVLQIASVRDVSRSSVAEGSGNANSHRRLLRLSLTDGHSEITAVEYSPIPSIPDDAIPGTKVLLKNKARIRSGIVCLDAKMITMLGGVVQSLYEEWQMNKKYSGFSRSSLRLSQETEAGGPPPFEKFQIQAPPQRYLQQGKFSEKTLSSSKSYGPTYVEKGESSERKQMVKPHNRDSEIDRKSDHAKSAAPMQRIEENPTSSEARPKQVAESLPVQNQMAAQKLLHKMSQTNQDGRHSRGRKHWGKGKQEESPGITLHEWERRKAGGNLLMRDGPSNVSQDEELAQQLQKKFDLEDRHVQKGPHVTEAEDIRNSMFNFDRGDAQAHSGKDYRGRGRGTRRRGRGRRG